MSPIAIQAIGYLGVLMNLIIYQQKTRTGILVAKLLSDIIWSAHYLLLGAIPGFLVACIGIAREITFIKVDKKSLTGRVFLGVFIAAAITSAVLTWENALSALPAAASVTSVIGFFISIPSLSRVLSFPISLCMGIYSYTNGSIAGVTNEIITVISSFIGIIRLDIKKNGDLKKDGLCKEGDK